MAVGVPIVASDCGAVHDIVDDGEQGYLVPVGDVDRFADRLRVLAGDAGLRARLGKAGRARAEREFNVERTARAYDPTWVTSWPWVSSQCAELRDHRSPQVKLRTKCGTQTDRLASARQSSRECLPAQRCRSGG
jgi:hypothetical protein